MAHPRRAKTRAESVAVSCVVELPRNFRVDDVLAFHRRDAMQIAERVDAHGLRKGITWKGKPACLGIDFDKRSAHAVLHVDKLNGTIASTVLRQFVERLLGLTEPVQEFVRHYRKHPQIGTLIRRRPGLRVPQSATPFEALSWAITGQQVSVAAAVAIRRRLIELAGAKHSSGIACYPDAARVAALSESKLRAAGYSATKAQTLLTLSRQVERGELPLDAWLAEPPIEDIRAQLLTVRGIGPWTINYALLRGFGYLDGSLHGDAAVRRGLQILLNRSGTISVDEAERWLAPFSPWRALVAAHLWALPPRAKD